jgi:queuine tRNA-ribosyltransferase
VSFAPRSTVAGSQARTGRLTLPRAAIETPAFMPVGTRGTVRTQAPGDLDRLGVGLILANTYHLWARPGLEVLRRVGGLAPWMDWRGAVLTDSGGFQVFSLGHACVVDDTGAVFRPHPDGPPRVLTPEIAIAAQEAIGSDVMMPLDHCVATTDSRDAVAAAMQRTHAWAHRCLAARSRPGKLFAIVQGGAVPELRRASADTLTAVDGFAGFAIGGLAVGEPRAEREDLTAIVTERLPTDRPRYLMGVGLPIDLLEAVHRGVDLFDCILPTALAQQGVAFTTIGRVGLRRTVYREDDGPLDPACPCPACTRVTRSYLHHLIKSAEPTGWSLLAFHNLRFYVELMRAIRDAIDGGQFLPFYARMRDQLERGDPAHPPGPPPRARRRTRGQS